MKIKKTYLWEEQKITGHIEHPIEYDILWLSTTVIKSKQMNDDKQRYYQQSYQ
jgi:hypothetical protein